MRHGIAIGIPGAIGRVPEWMPVDANLLLHLRSTLNVSGDPVDDWTDTGQGSLGANFDGTTTTRPTVGSVNSRASILFDDTDDYLDSDQAAGSFKCLHDGTGGALIVVARPTASGSLWDTIRPLNTRTGCYLTWNDTNDTVDVQIGNGGGVAFTVDDASSTNSAPNGSTFVAGLRLDGPDDDYELWVNGTKEANGSYTGTPSTGNETQVARLGSWASGGNPLGGHILEVLVYDYAPSNADWATILAALGGIYL